jgi:hypothetical protein
MHPRDGDVPADDEDDELDEEDEESQDSQDDAVIRIEPLRLESIRDRQRRRRDATRPPTDLAAILAGADRAEEEEEEEEEGPPPGPPPPRVFVVFRGADWEDPQGVLRESDTIAGVYATEEAARRAVATLEREGGAAGNSWYQPYAVQE